MVQKTFDELNTLFFLVFFKVPHVKEMSHKWEENAHSSGKGSPKEGKEWDQRSHTSGKKRATQVGKKA